ncbi:adipocyte plasma membrane-associated protein-like [Tropilaelaps mercedesae]|uniref:Adipocyte plasma membrane-associated protein-like n=1 Tax=Tropilaelaps mercedesae TaxID=418985 RepID=A0A1V9X697_9ACAR|nr:adipocyte plasma membrane-associated protein-like [Tropilaelaps mercedesae]
MRLQRDIASTSVLLLVFACGATPTFGDEHPLCFAYGDGESFCSASAVENGKSLSSLLESVLQLTVDRTKRLEVTSNEPFTDPIPDAVGPLQFNRKLDIGSKTILNFLNGPESFVKQGDFIYAAASDGIYKVNVKLNEHQKLFDGQAGCNAPDRNSCSRPLGIRIKDKTLLFVDPFKGLVSIDTETGDFKVLVPIGADIEGEKVTFPDDLDVDWARGLVYFSDGSTKWGLQFWMMSVLENDPSGRVIQFNLKTGDASVFAKGIRFANGIQIARDGKSLLVSEFSARRILQYSFDQTLPATGTPFTKQSLPGHPDNLRPSLSGGYWVALALAGINGSRTIVDELQASLNRDCIPTHCGLDRMQQKDSATGCCQQEKWLKSSDNWEIGATSLILAPSVTDLVISNSTNFPSTLPRVSSWKVPHSVTRTNREHEMATSGAPVESATANQEDRQGTYRDESKAPQINNVPRDEVPPPNNHQLPPANSALPASGNKELATSQSGKQSTASHIGVELIASDLRGTVKWYNAVMRYGFIVRTDTQRDIFVHRNSIVMAPREVAWLNADQPVTFDLWTLPCGRFDAKNVRSANGAPISFGNLGPPVPVGPFPSAPVRQRRPVPSQHPPVTNTQQFRQQHPGRPHNGPLFRGQYVYCPGCGRMLGVPFGHPRTNGAGFKPNMVNERVVCRN